jgi:hypothetical protein
MHIRAMRVASMQIFGKGYDEMLLLVSGYEVSGGFAGLFGGRIMDWTMVADISQQSRQAGKSCDGRSYCSCG